MIQTGTNRAQEVNFARSAMAPLMSATVRMANVALYPALIKSGEPMTLLRPKLAKGLPNTPRTPWPVVIE